MTSPRRPSDAWLALRHCRTAYNAFEARSNQIEAIAWRLIHDLVDHEQGNPALIVELRDALRAPRIEPWT